MAAFMALNICSAVPPEALWVCVGFIIRFWAGIPNSFSILCDTVLHTCSPSMPVSTETKAALVAPLSITIALA